ncbi:MAG: multi-sensor hybrid histidine kinase [Chthoniobacteraceae bacterium]|nr:multi-sensor hybrid histidine kinase [Chthoniobacteraceae bacterium]
MAAPLIELVEVEMPGSLKPTEKVNILLVDDREDKLLTLRVMLEDLNENLVIARSGEEALRKLLQQEFAVIILDVNMPVMDGFETAVMIRMRPRSETTPIIFFSAVNDTETHVSRGYSLGAVDYILTPVVPEILRAKIAVFVDLFRKTEQVKRQSDERAEFIREQAARAEAEAAQRHFAFLAEASNVLAASLDYKETFENLARLVVPILADFCIVDVTEQNGTLRQVAVAHRDPAKEAKLRQLTDHYPLNLTVRHGGTRVFQTGRLEWNCSVDDAALSEMFEDERTREIVRSLKPIGYIAVPLLARGRVIGAITMVNTDPARVCGIKEVSLAEQLAQRAALALDNAALYQSAQKARTDAERANMAKDRFLAMLSHELRTPLTPVINSVSLLESMSDLPSEIRPQLQMIRRNVELEARLIDDLLDLTRISKGKVQLNLAVVDAQALLRSAIEICGPDIEAKELVLHTEFNASRCHLNADPARLQQIFWNLIKNAVKFTHPKGELTIRTANDEGGALRVEVIDTGIGILKEMLPKIFNAFEQVEDSKAGGLGLGLAITKAMVALHRGRIEAVSDGADKGSKFTVWFPTASAATEAGGSGATKSPQARKSLRVLLVEDHEDSNYSLTQLLKKRGYEVCSTRSVATALEAAEQFNFDVLVSDMGLPDGTGNDIITSLTIKRPVFGIALTGYGMESDIQQSSAAGFAHHLIKPADLKQLDELIQSAN